MSEDQGQGLSRRDLLKRGAALGGAVVWATPIVQTLGMGRAFAQTASPTTTTTTTPNGGQDISYIGINIADCGPDGTFVKWEDGDWENDPGAAPVCADKSELGDAANGGSLGFSVTPLTGSCASLTIPATTTTGCTITTVTVWVKAGQTCNTYVLGPGTHTVCSAS